MINGYRWQVAGGILILSREARFCVSASPPKCDSKPFRRCCSGAGEKGDSQECHSKCDSKPFRRCCSGAGEKGDSQECH